VRLGTGAIANGGKRTSFDEPRVLMFYC